MIALIDSDLVAYRCAATCQAEDDVVDTAILRVDKLMREILDAVNCDEYKAFLSGENNFRMVVNPDYKANRKDMIRPQFLQQCREFLIEEWNAKLSHGCEADDLLGINQVPQRNGFNQGDADYTILCSLDKDLLMIPGKHYNWVKQIFTEVDAFDGIKHFWKQMLIGDTSDNIQGIRGIGPVKASRYIDVCDSEQEMFDTVYEMYDDPRRFVMNAQCLWIMRNEGETWANQVNLTLPKECRQEVAAQLDFMKSLNPTI